MLEAITKPNHIHMYNKIISMYEPNIAIAMYLHISTYIALHNSFQYTCIQVAKLHRYYNYYSINSHIKQS